MAAVPEQTVSPVELRPYTYDKYKFKLSVPASWHFMAPQGNTGVAASFVPGMKSFDMDENIIINCVDLSLAEIADLETFTNRSIEQLRGEGLMEANYQLVDCVMAGLPAKRLRYQASLPGAKLRNMQQWAVFGQIAYIVTYSRVVRDTPPTVPYLSFDSVLLCFETFELLPGVPNLLQEMLDMTFVTHFVRAEHVVFDCPKDWRVDHQPTSNAFALSAKYSGPLHEGEKRSVELDLSVVIDTLPAALAALPSDEDKLDRYMSMFLQQFKKVNLALPHVQSGAQPDHDGTALACRSVLWDIPEAHRSQTFRIVVRRDKVFTVTVTKKGALDDDRTAWFLDHLLSAFRFAPPREIVFPSWVKFVLRDPKFSIRYPDADYAPQTSLELALHLSRRNTSTQQEVTIISRKNVQNAPFEELQQEFIQQLRFTIPSLTVDAKSSAVSKSGLAALVIDFHCEHPDQRTYFCKQYYYMIHDCVMVVWYSAPKEFYYNGLRTFDTIALSVEQL